MVVNTFYVVYWSKKTQLCFNAETGVAWIAAGVNSGSNSPDAGNGLLLKCLAAKGQGLVPSTLGRPFYDILRGFRGREGGAHKTPAPPRIPCTHHPKHNHTSVILAYSELTQGTPIHMANIQQ